jgi:benzoate 4-monooxygenase
MQIADVVLSPWALLAIPFLFWIVPWLRNSSIRSIPGPKIAAFTNLWMLWYARNTKISVAVKAAHEKYGKMVRVVS